MPGSCITAATECMRLWNGIEKRTAGERRCICLRKGQRVGREPGLTCLHTKSALNTSRTRRLTAYHRTRVTQWRTRLRKRSIARQLARGEIIKASSVCKHSCANHSCLPICAHLYNMEEPGEGSRGQGSEASPGGQMPVVPPYSRRQAQAGREQVPRPSRSYWWCAVYSNTHKITHSALFQNPIPSLQQLLPSSGLLTPQT